MVAVGILVEDLPAEVAYLGLVSGVDAACAGLAIEGESVFALEVEGRAVAEFSGFGKLARRVAVGLLEHEGCAAERHPDPAQMAVGDPAVLDSEAEALDIELEGAFHAGDHEQGGYAGYVA